ncbi:leucyl/phenylalanyl-tRNA--protein transferase [Zunongwangia sp. H14]|uniref:leucyl/phenylalanyl-tRNA--protein transferase n=1 Tax=Zunongwangia sp. H14 TaxID=3240792 RepID=UPI0035630005
MHILKNNDNFPPVEYACKDGLLAIGGDLSLQRLKDAYEKGIFPWYNESQPVLWWSPNPRMILFPEKLKVSRSMKRLLKKEAFKVTYNEAFAEVIHNCASIERKGQNGTWLTGEMKRAYLGLHQLGLAISVEVWEDKELVGGLYGIYLKEKHVFCGESMFTKKSNASKYGFIHLVRKLREQGVKLIDCQVYTKHLESLGAEEISREDFMEFLK